MNRDQKTIPCTTKTKSNRCNKDVLNELWLEKQLNEDNEETYRQLKSKQKTKQKKYAPVHNLGFELRITANALSTFCQEGKAY